jgi:hypothetical protein
MNFEGLKNDILLEILHKEGVTTQGVTMHPAFFKDVSLLIAKSLAETSIYLDLEIAKVESKGMMLEARKLKAIRRSVDQSGSDIFNIRETYVTKAPDLMRDL